MANDEVLGARKTMFVLVIVVGCFAVLWPRILSPLILGHTTEQLKPNQFDRDAGCCEVIFETDVAVLELVNEVCNSALKDGKFSAQSAIECRKAVNETCGFDIAAFVKRNENVGKTTKMIVESMKNSNSSCLRQHFGVPVYSMGNHFALSYWNHTDTLKQERPPIRMTPHPALRERGRAIPPGTPPPTRPVALPPHIRYTINNGNCLRNMSSDYTTMSKETDARQSYLLSVRACAQCWRPSTVALSIR